MEPNVETGAVAPDNSARLVAGMNPEQAAVVAHVDGPLLVAAVAGCGKTRVLVHRVAALVERGVDPRRILAVTFSSKAAREMTERLEELGCTSSRVGTFHSLAFQILREERLPMASWDVDDRDRYRVCVKEALGYRYLNWQDADITQLLGWIGRCKAAAIRSDTPEARASAKEFFDARPCAQRDPDMLASAYSIAEKIRRDRKIITFDDMLVEAVYHLEANETARVSWASKYDYVLQDECFIGETPVLLADGTTKTIREIVEQKWAGSVLTWSPTTGTVARPVISWSRKALARKLVRVRIRQRGFKLTGEPFSDVTNSVRYTVRYLVCTEDHPVWTTTRGWVAAGMLRTDDVAQVETVAPWLAPYANHIKHSQTGRRRLGEMMREKNRRGVCGASRSTSRHFAVRGGNGTGPSPSEAALLERLGDGWEFAYVVPTGRSSKNGPTHYKIDIANAARKIAIELDGGSHGNASRRAADDRKDSFLRSRGWDVIRMTNEESWSMDASLGYEREARCPAPAQVLSVEPWEPQSPWVYDIGVDETHAFYADGVLVHNCQDENVAQRRLAVALAKDHRNYMVVGDPGQAIYGFRGSDPSGMLGFEAQWSATTIRMVRNYRCGRAIVDAANKSLRAMPKGTHLETEMIAERDHAGEVGATRYDSFDDEGAGVVRKILEARADGRNWRDFAVLYRTNAQSRGVEEALIGARIPYVVIGGTNFYERREVKDLLAYLRIAAGRGDFADDVRRSINTPFRYLGKAFIDSLGRAVRNGRSWSAHVRAFVTSGQAKLQHRQVGSVLGWCGIIEGLERSLAAAAVVADDHPDALAARPAVLLEGLVQDLDYNRWLTRDDGSESPENNRVSNVRELIRAAERFRSVDELLEYIADTLERARADKGDGDRVTVTSLHRSKGLEWPVVFVLGCNEKILPHGLAETDVEERRLFYVGVTRARDRLELSCVSQAAIGPKVVRLEPSRFLDEIGIVPSAAAEVQS